MLRRPGTVLRPLEVVFGRSWESPVLIKIDVDEMKIISRYSADRLCAGLRAQSGLESQHASGAERPGADFGPGRGGRGGRL